MKVYYCLSQDSKRIVVEAKTKKDASAATGISSDLFVVCHDPKMASIATPGGMIETTTSWEPYNRNA